MYYETNKEEFAKECAQADSFSELVPLAIRELKKFPNEVEIVCGPISTGGRGSVEENLKVFFSTIKGMQESGHPIFNQVPYEDRIFAFRKKWQDEDPSRAGAYYMPILEEFYLPIFQTGKIKKAYFISGWESSKGASWEREELAKVGAKIIDLKEHEINSFLMDAGISTH